MRFFLIYFRNRNLNLCHCEAVFWTKQSFYFPKIASSFKSTPRNDTWGVILFLILMVLFWPGLSFAESKASAVKKGNLLFQEKKYDQAFEKYNAALDKDPNSAIINFDAGAALYKKGRVDQSISSFQKSLLSDDPTLQQKAQYNLGNSFFKAGEAKEKANLEGAIKSLEQSVSSYEKSLALKNDDEDAKFNYELAKKKLEQLKQKQLQQKQQKQDQEKKQPNQDQKDQDKNNQQKDQPQENPQDQNKPNEENQPKPADSNQDKNKPEDKKDQNESDPSKNQEEDQKPKDQNKEDSSDENEDQEKPDQGDQNSQNEQSGSGDAPQPNPKDLTDQEAKMMLENYSQNEEPKGLLNFNTKSPDERSVLKDW